MPDFFEQMCQIIADSENQHTGIPADSAEVAKFFRARPVQTPPAPPVQTPAAVQPPVQRAVQTPAPAIHPEPSAAISSPATAVPPVSGNFATLEDIRNAVSSCRNCVLCKIRNNTVFGEGDPHAKLMFIGEAPGRDEDIQGRPFVGKAGMLLDKMISAMQFSREEVYIANIVKCRPPDNRAPAPEEVQCCIGYLKRQIELIQPEVIVLLGAVAVKYLLNVTSGISRLRGRWLSYENIPVMATFHPAFLLRQESAKRETWNDLQQVMARFGKYHRPGNSGVKPR